MSQVTELASGQITAVNSITIDLIQADETPAAVIIRWPAKPSVLHPRRFPAAADTAARFFTAAVVRLAQIRPDRKLCSVKRVRPGLPGVREGSDPRGGGRREGFVV
jgi:hypothetical protein